jgi:hypothetical protein
MSYMNTSVDNIYSEFYYNTSSNDFPNTNFSYNNISESNINAINLIKSYSSLRSNWDSYNAIPPSNQAIQKAITFILWLSDYNIDVFFVAPTPNGEILVEIKEGNSNIEFEFSSDSEDSICATHEGDFIAEDVLNDTTQISYLKWLIYPDGNCPPNL